MLDFEFQFFFFDHGGIEDTEVHKDFIDMQILNLLI